MCAGVCVCMFVIEKIVGRAYFTTTRLCEKDTSSTEYALPSLQNEVGVGHASSRFHK